MVEAPREGDILVVTLKSSKYSFTGNKKKHGEEWEKIFYTYIVASIYLGS